MTVQGGLPVVIATPAHGTAFDIAVTMAARRLASNSNDSNLAVNAASEAAGQKCKGDMQDNEYFSHVRMRMKVRLEAVSDDCDRISLDKLLNDIFVADSIDSTGTVYENNDGG